MDYWITNSQELTQLAAKNTKFPSSAVTRESSRLYPRANGIWVNVDERGCLANREVGILLCTGSLNMGKGCANLFPHDRAKQLPQFLRKEDGQCGHNGF